MSDTRTRPTLAQATAAVEAHLGFVEGGGPDGRSGNITPWGARTGTQGQPWCASGLTCVLADAGAPVAIRTAVRTMEAEARAAGKWSSTPAPGYIMVFDFTRDGVADHCEFVTACLARQVNTIGYNTAPTDAGDQRNGGMVVRKVRRTDAPTVRGYIVVEYAPAVIPVPREEPQPSGSLPVVPAPAPAPAPATRVKVKKGQTLTRIAAAAGISLAALLAVNPSLATNPSSIFPGQYVTIPGQGTPAPAPAPSASAGGTPAPTTAPSPSAVPVAPRPVLTRYIGPWTKGDDVKAVQRVLGFTGRDVDGIGGPKTATSLRKWQRAHGLTDDAVVGRATAEAMGFEWKGPR